MDDQVSVSIIIATYNRSDMLAETLRSLHLHGCGNAEIIVVNNNSPDDTQAVASSFKELFPRFQLLSETQQGLSFARNCGIAAASGDILVFLDDDVEVDANWLPELIAPLKDPKVAVSGGRVLAFGMQVLPDWLPREYGYLASVFDPVESVCEMDKVMGGNSAIHRQVLDQVGLFDVKLGRQGTKLMGGEEVELYNRIRGAGFKIMYTPHAVIWHKISAKLKPEYMENYAYWLGASEALIDKNIAAGSKYLIKLARSWLFPWSVYRIQKMASSLDPAAPMRYAIKRNYARGYIQHKQARAGV